MRNTQKEPDGLLCGFFGGGFTGTRAPRKRRPIRETLRISDMNLGEFGREKGREARGHMAVRGLNTALDTRQIPTVGTDMSGNKGESQAANTAHFT
jgi:hypothetical protein